MRSLILLTTVLAAATAFAADPNPFKPNSSPAPTPSAPVQAMPGSVPNPNGLPPPGVMPGMPETPPVLPGQEIKETGERIGMVNGRNIYRSANNRYFIEPSANQK